MFILYGGSLPGDWGLNMEKKKKKQQQINNFRSLMEEEQLPL